MRHMEVTSRFPYEQVLCYCWLSEFVRCVVDNPWCNVILNKDRKLVSSWNIYTKIKRETDRHWRQLAAQMPILFHPRIIQCLNTQLHACFGGFNFINIQTRYECQYWSWRVEPFVKHRLGRRNLFTLWNLAFIVMICVFKKCSHLLKLVYNWKIYFDHLCLEHKILIVPNAWLLIGTIFSAKRERSLKIVFMYNFCCMKFLYENWISPNLI